MTIVSANLIPTVTWAAPRYPFEAWAQGVSSLVQQCGVSKTQLPGFGIYNRVSMRWQAITGGGSGSPSFTIPTNIVTGDVMIVSVAIPSGTTVTTPSGWNAIRNDTAAGGTGPVSCYLYWRAAAGTGGSLSTDCGTTVTFTTSSTSVGAMASFSAYAGVNTTTPVNVQGVASSSVNGTTATAGAQTTTVANCYVLQVVSTDSASIASLTTPASYTQRVAPTGQTNTLVNSAIYDILQAAAGTTGTPAVTLGSTGSWLVQTIGLTPAPSFVPTVTAASGGTLTQSTTYYYRVAALNAQGSTLPCPEVSGTTGTNGSGNLSMQISWSAVANATGYNIYGRTTGAEQLIATVGAVTSYTDTGSISPSGSMPTSDTTCDTGQINFAASTVGVAASTKIGYEIYQLTDSNQASFPVFVRIDYGTGGSAGNPQIWFTTGTATNGTGTVQASSAFPNSVVSSALNMFSTAASGWNSTSASAMYADSDGGSSLMIAGWANALGSGSSANSGGVGLVERTRDWNGTVNTEGVTTVGAAPSAGSYTYFLFNNASQFVAPAANSTGPAIIFTNQLLTPNNQASVGSTVYVYPLPGPLTPKWNGPSKHLVLCWLGDIVNGASFSITQYGSSHTFIKTNGLLTTPLCVCFRSA